MSDNPLASRRPRLASQTDADMQRHADIWHHMHQQDPQTLQGHIEGLDYGLPVMGEFAANPKTSAKDVIKAVSSAVAEGKMDPSAGVGMISAMPADPDKLKAWLRDKYATFLTAAVHAKAAMIAHQTGTMPAMQASAQPQPLAAPPQGAPPGVTLQ